MESIFNGTVLAWREAALALNTAGKHFTVSLKQSFDSVASRSASFPPESKACKGGLQGARRFGAEDIIFDIMKGEGNEQAAAWFPFRQFNIPSKDFGKDAAGCVAAIENVKLETAGDQPSFICCNDANKTRDGGAGLNLSIAAYLMNANNNSYFGPGSHWSNNGWDTVFDDFPQLTRPLGAPLSATFRRDGPFKFSRSFEHLDVKLDCHPTPTCAKHIGEPSCGGDATGGCLWLKTAGTGGLCSDVPKAEFHWK
jgi:hypothetical protein